MSTTMVTAIMTKDVECVSPDQKIVDIKHIYEQQRFHHHIPVVENNVLVGMVSLIDFMRRIGQANLDDNQEVYQSIFVKDIMSANPTYLLEDASIQDVAEVLSEGRVHALPILNSSKEVVGIVSTADLIAYYLRKQ